MKKLLLSILLLFIALPLYAQQCDECSQDFLAMSPAFIGGGSTVAAAGDGSIGTTVTDASTVDLLTGYLYYGTYTTDTTGNVRYFHIYTTDGNGVTLCLQLMSTDGTILHSCEMTMSDDTAGWDTCDAGSAYSLGSGDHLIGIINKSVSDPVIERENNNDTQYYNEEGTGWTCGTTIAPGSYSAGSSDTWTITINNSAGDPS